MESNKYLDKISDICCDCATELIALFKKNNLKAIYFKQHPDVDAPCITFENNDLESQYCEVESITINEFENSPKNDNLEVMGVDPDGNQWYAYIDWWGGDFFAVGQDIGKIYAGVAEVLNLGMICNNELK